MQKRSSGKKVPSWEVVGALLATFRRQAGLKQVELADRFNVGEEAIASMKQGRRRLRMELARQMDEFLKTKGALTAAVEKIPAREKYPAFARDFIEHEREAITLQWYENQVIPGLLQTPEYARKVFENSCPPLGPAELEEAVQARLERQQILQRETPPLMSVVIEEQVLQRHLGDKAMMRQQIQHLLDCADLPFMCLQIMPTETPIHPCLGGPLILLETPDHEHLAWLEGNHNGWLVDDPSEISRYQQKYGMLRAQALSPEASKALLNKVLGVT
ncbi:helix-turn-helix domain-containing protein [Streptomyces koyangensis]